MKNARLSPMAVGLIFGIAIIVLSPLFGGKGKWKDVLPTRHHIYTGKYQDYDVEIEDATNDPYLGQGTVRLIHLHRPGDPSYVVTTGHDINNDGRWDRVFRCGYPTGHEGCNAYEYDQARVPQWSPCPADKDKLEPWTMGELIEAEALLNSAMIVVHNPSHLNTSL